MANSVGEMYAEYMSKHRNRASRALHALFFVLGVTWVTLAVARHNPLWLLLIGPIWTLPHYGHYRIEGNAPATPAMMRARAGSGIGYFLWAHVVEVGILALMVVEVTGLISLDPPSSARE